MSTLTSLATTTSADQLRHDRSTDGLTRTSVIICGNFPTAEAIYNRLLDLPRIKQRMSVLVRQQVVRHHMAGMREDSAPDDLSDDLSVRKRFSLRIQQGHLSRLLQFLNSQNIYFSGQARRLIITGPWSREIGHALQAASLPALFKQLGMQEAYGNRIAQAVSQGKVVFVLSSVVRQEDALLRRLKDREFPAFEYHHNTQVNSVFIDSDHLFQRYQQNQLAKDKNPTRMNRELIISNLNRLIKILEDGREGYKLAADNVDIPGYESLFLKMSQKRAKMASELRQMVVGMGEEPADTGTWLAPIHRAWLNLRTAISTRDTYAVIDECRRGDEYALEEFQAALETNMPDNVKSTIGRMTEGLAESINEMKEFVAIRA